MNWFSCALQAARTVLVKRKDAISADVISLRNVEKVNYVVPDSDDEELRSQVDETEEVDDSPSGSTIENLIKKKFYTLLKFAIICRHWQREPTQISNT